MYTKREKYSLTKMLTTDSRTINRKWNQDTDLKYRCFFSFLSVRQGEELQTLLNSTYLSLLPLPEEHQK